MAVPDELHAESRDLESCAASPSNTKVFYSERSDEVNNMNSENKPAECCDAQCEVAPREVAQIVEEVIDDLKWSYAVMREWYRGEPEDFGELAAVYKEVLLRHDPHPDFYSDGTLIGAKYLERQYEWIRYKAMEPPHRRCASENCRCKELKSHQDAGRRSDESESADEKGVTW